MLSFDCQLTVLDAFFEEGNGLLLRVGLALIQLCEEDLFVGRDIGDFMTILSNFGSVSSSQLFLIVRRIVLESGLLRQDRLNQTFEESKRLALLTRAKDLKRLFPIFRRFTSYEVENIYDFAIPYFKSDGLQFVQFQTILPNFVSLNLFWLFCFYIFFFPSAVFWIGSSFYAAFV